MLHYSWSPQWPSFPARGVDRPRLLDRRVIGLILAIVGVLIGGLTVAPGLGALASLSTPVPAARLSTASPTEQVLTYAVGWRGPDEDPPMVLPSGQSVKSSNYRGVPIGQVVYYYNLAPLPSFDPLARGEVTAQQIQVVAVVGDPPSRVMIYTVP